MISQLQVSNTMMLLIGLYATAWYFLFKSPDRFIFFCLALLGLALPMVHLIEKMQHRKTRAIHVLNLYGATAIIHQHGHHAIMTVSASLLDNRKKTEELLSQTGIALDIEHWKIQSFPEDPVMISQQKVPENKPWVMLCHGKSISLSDLKNEINKESLIIAGASTPVWKINQWEKESQKLHLRFKSLSEEGPFMIRCHQTQ